MKCKWFRMCPLRRFEADGRLSSEWAERYCMRDWQTCRRYQLEEQGIAHPDSLMPDGSIDERLT
jgi:DNA polymerase